VSQARLNESATAFSDGDCARAIDSGLAASEAAGTRPEPFELIGLCDARLGKGDLAVAALENAVERDPDNWEYHYGLALVKAIDGQDPRPEAAAALRLNPRERLAQAAVKGLRQGGAARRRTFAERAPLPVP
jgi:Flp pilus assembly protein TadD